METSQFQDFYGEYVDTKDKKSAHGEPSIYHFFSRLIVPINHSFLELQPLTRCYLHNYTAEVACSDRETLSGPRFAFH